VLPINRALAELWGAGNRWTGPGNTSFAVERATRTQAGSPRVQFWVDDRAEHSLHPNSL